MVAQQRLLLEWVTRTLLTNHRLFGIADGTQAMSWRIVGQHQEWDDWCRRLLVETLATADTCWDRFFALRTQTVQALLEQDIIHATHHIDHLEELIRESADGELDLEVQAVLLQFPTVDRARVQQIGEKARARWESLASAWNPPTTAQRRSLRRLAHNLGAGLFRSSFYDLALPLLQRAADLGSTTATTYEWLADCLHYEQHDTDRIPALLEQAAARR